MLKSRTAHKGFLLRRHLSAAGLIIVAILIHLGSAFAQDLLQPGEAFVTRFSGTTASGADTVIDTNGTVGSIVDLRNPAQAPRGQHWLNEPQRLPVTAGQVGQVFGVALDAARSPNIFITATSAFGLHRTVDNTGWMPGMWGQGGGPGTVWKLDAANRYQPSVFATITLDGRENSAAALGNIAFDGWNNQLYVSDLETGMIHRLSASDGADLGRYDHGIEGRRNFFDAPSGSQKTLPERVFDTNSAARINDCPAGEFTKTPSCWNFADFRRRVWGVGVRKDQTSGAVRLYYSVWSSQGFGNLDFAAAADEEKRNSIWSVAIRQDGAFDTASVRRELFLPDFFIDPVDITRAGRSHPVTDIAFPKCSTRGSVMLLAERGGVRNLGLDQENAFANPHESRVLRCERNATGTWQVTGRYDVGFYDRKNDNQPFLRSNSAGGIDFGFGHDWDWAIDLKKADQFVWMSGDALCSPQGPCFVPFTGKREDGSQVHGPQGTPEFAFDELSPFGATQPYPPGGDPYPPMGPTQSYMIDADINTNAGGSVDMDSLTRNDATRIGDIEIYEPCDAGPPVVEPPLVVDPPIVEDPPLIVDPPIEEGPDLEKTKTGPATCVEGDICTFTITVTNNGPGTWSGPLRELDTLPPNSFLVDYRPQPDWLCNQAPGTQDVVCTYPWADLAPGDSVTLEIDVLLPFGIAGQVIENCVADIWLPSRDPNDPAVILAIEQILAGYGYPVGPIDGILDVNTMNAIAQFQFDNGLPQTGLPDQTLIDLLFPGSGGLMGDWNPANDADCHQVQILPAPAPPVQGPAPVPDIEIRKSQITGQCSPGAICTFQLTFVNRGPGNWTGTPEIVDTLPAGATLVPAGSPFYCSQAGNIVTCRSPQQRTLLPNVPGFDTIRVRMPANFQPGMRNCVDLGPTIAATDPNPGNNRVCVRIRARSPVPDIQIRKIQKPAVCEAGGTCSFDLWFINLGPGTFKGSPRIIDTLPKGVKLKSASKPWNCRAAANNVTCSHPRLPLRPGRAMRVTLTVKLPKDIKKGTENCARRQYVAGTPRDPVRQNDKECIPVKVKEPPKPPEPPHETPPPHPTPPAGPGNIRIEKIQSGHCKPGGSCAFEMWYINLGPGKWSGIPQLSDVLPVGGALVSDWAPRGDWECKVGGRSALCTHNPVSLPVGESVRLRLVVDMPTTLTDGAQNCVIRVGPPDSNPGDDRHCIPVKVTTLPPGYTPHPPAITTPHPPHQEPPSTSCPRGTRPSGNVCIKDCPKGYKLSHGKCIKRVKKCPRGYKKVRGKCIKPVKKCPYGYRKVGNKCIRPPKKCPYGTIQIGNVCIRIQTGPTIRIPGGRPPSSGHPH